MSNRVFKKVFGKEELGTPDSDDDHHPFSGAAPSKKLNPYALLNELSESEAKEDDGEGERDSEASSKMDQDEVAGGGKKKRRKKRPAKKKKLQTQLTPCDTEMEEELEAAAASNNKSPQQKKHGGRKMDDTLPPKINKEFEELFKIDPKFINSEYELKRMFGAKIINYERNKPGQRRIMRHGASRLVMPKEQWPSVTGSGISMSYLNTIDGFMYFKFEHNSHYRDVQKQFMRAVNTYNPDNIVNIMRQYPYHVDSHIQLSDMAKAAEDMQVASDLIEGAVHCLENAFHVRFQLTNPLCRLQYNFQENRSFFLVLFKHLIFVGSRACHRTALELCKRLLTLDPDTDPLCSTLMIDFYAVKAGEIQWFVDLYNFWEKPRNLSQLPNFSYSVALSYHLLAEKAQSSSKTSEENLELAEKADTLIQYAILMFPSVLLPLLDKIGVQIDSRAKLHNYLNAFAQSSQSRSLRLLCELYVWRTYHVWRETSVLPWLEKNVKIVLDKVDKKDPIVRDFEEKRKRRYLATTPRNILRHVILMDNKDLTFNFPPELSKEPIMGYDPLPPPESISIYDVKEFQQPPRNAPRTGGRGRILNLLLDSLWNDLNAPEVGENRGIDDVHLGVDNLEEAAAAVGGENPVALGAGLQQSVTALLDAMRELLSNANTRREGEADAADGEESGTEQD